MHDAFDCIDNIQSAAHIWMLLMQRKYKNLLTIYDYLDLILWFSWNIPQKMHSLNKCTFVWNVPLFDCSIQTVDAYQNHKQHFEWCTHLTYF